MDFGAIIALVIGVGTILIGNFIEGGSPLELVQLAALFIVFGGTFGATMLGSTTADFLAALRAVRLVFTKPKTSLRDDIDELTQYAQVARRDGIIALEDAAAATKNAFMGRALLLAVDGADEKRMRDNLEVLLMNEEEARAKSARVWEQAGGYAPTIGIIGAVLGLIHTMGNIAEVSQVTAGIGVAFVSTVYGVALANLFCLPIAARLRALARDDMRRLQMIFEGALAIQEGQNPLLIREKLENFLVYRPEPEEAVPSAPDSPGSAP